MLGSFFFESTTGFSVIIKGTFTAGQSLKNVLWLPVLLVFRLALTLNLAGLSLPEPLAKYYNQFKTVYFLLGMMMIGMDLTGLR